MGCDVSCTEDNHERESCQTGEESHDEEAAADGFDKANRPGHVLRLGNSELGKVLNGRGDVFQLLKTHENELRPPNDTKKEEQKGLKGDCPPHHTIINTD